MAVATPGSLLAGSLAAFSLVGCGGDTSPPEGFEPPPPEPSEPTVSVNESESYQKLQGFGAALAWYTDTLVSHPKKTELFDVVFAELGLDIVRFRNRFERSSEPVDLTQELEIYEAATESLGEPPKVLITSWSPPADLKQNGAEDCSVPESDEEDPVEPCTLRRQDGEFVYDEFADYWARSLEEYAELGIDVDYISIQNEPGFQPNWEGCRFDPSESAEYPGYDRAFEAVRERLSESSQKPLMLGPETLGVHHGRTEGYLAQLDMSQVDAVAHHLYEGDTWKAPGPDDYLDPLRGVASAAGDLPIFQTEFSTTNDEFVLGGFETAWLIENSLVQGNASAWLYWDLVWPCGGLVALPGFSCDRVEPDGYLLRDQYYSLRHFARFTDPGCVRVAAESNRRSIRATAFVSPDESRLTLVVLNVAPADSEPVPVELVFSEQDREIEQIYLSVYRPESGSVLWQEKDAEPVLGLPGYSVATVLAE